ncbi:type VI secretion system tip protein TssI/VgrG [Advenella mimigardefordensis]|uniref:Putative type VI secretion system YD repeat-containing Rhs element Vgr protein n=1 Tax=Advenella mimigardefordensis (strain DSM 17166 / LMG 22922 / DPN7) TaxID=1247726 RepID=W0PFK2_ADVMD|nr:type VI secretion system tip protein TssI/VgrG [Advenella mimigardefordensis]AHG65456.1 putative type VI secretion system YD repeat-containing Rhs element Vgr protein [Advenella mimigardefordensis DPN7]
MSANTKILNVINPDRLIGVSIAAENAEFLFDAMQGTDGMSTLSDYTVRLLHRSMQVDVRSLLGKSLTLTINTAAAPRYINGVIASFALVGQEGDADRYFVYEARVAPWFWLATHKKEFRIYQNQSVPETIKQVLSPYGYAFEFDLVESYAPRVYCVQYDETDFQFVSRLLEAEGIHYYFRHEQDKHTLVMSDEVQSHKPVDGYEHVPYFTEDKLTLPQQDYMTHVAVFQDLRPGQYTTNDYNFTTPKADLAARQQIELEHEHNQSEVYEWPGNYGDNPLGERYARQRMQEQHHIRDTKTLRSTARGVATGSLFNLIRCPRTEENREYVVLSTRYDLKENNYHSVSSPEEAIQNGRRCVFDLTVQCTTLPFRPPRTTRKPRTLGPQTAVVVGPEGKEIWTNEYGQVKVHFHWDRYDKRDENSSCWIRVSSAWASGNFGAIQVPRIGDEVIVDFLNGDPDAPIITGRVYNAAMMPPWTLPDNATQMGLYSRSSPGGSYDTANAIRFEDKKGQEQLWIHAERDQDVEVEHNDTLTVGNNKTDKIRWHWKLHTGGYKQETVDLASVQSVGLGKMMNVGLAYNVNVGGLYLRNIGLQMASTVGMDRTDRVVQSWTSDVGHVYSVTVRGKAVQTAVQKEQEQPLLATPYFQPQLPGEVESSDANQIRITDSGQASLSGAQYAKLIGPGGVITIDEAGIRIRGKGIYLQAPIISMTGGDAQGLVPVTEADAAECAKRTTSQHPVDVATGQKILVAEDFVLPGRLPIRWNRMYRSADQRQGCLGVAWKLPYSTEIRQGTAGLVYFDADGRQLNFPDLAVGEEHFHPIEKYTLQRIEDHASQSRYIIRFINGNEEHYERHSKASKRWRLHRVTTRDGQWLELKYTAAGGLEYVRNNRHTVRCELDAQERIVALHLVGDEHGQPLARYAYDEQGDLVRAADRGGRVWRYRYTHHLLNEYRTPSGAVHVSEWDGDTPQAKCVRTYAYAENAAAPGAKPMITRDTRFTYLPASKMTQVTDGLGNTTEYHYNGLWAVDRVTHPDGSVEQIHFDETGSISGRTDELGRSTRLVNNAAGSPTSMIDAAGNVTSLSYNAQNQPVQITDPAGHVWQRSYDEAGNLASETDPLGHSTSYAYANGLPVSRTDAKGNITKTQWDDAGQLASQVDCSGNTSSYKYDKLGQIETATNAAGQSTHYQWNNAGQMERSQTSDQGSWSTEYDRAGRPVVQKNALGNSVHTQWNVYDQPVVVTDHTGRRTSYAYDELGRVTGVTNAKGETMSFVYDSRGRLIEQTGFDSRQQSYRFNAASELIERIEHGQDGQLVTRIIYDAVGRVIERQFADGSQDSYRYDPRGLLLQARAVKPGQPDSQMTFEHDAAGNCIAETQSHQGHVVRLTHVLDALGKRESTHIPAVGTLTLQRYGSGHVHGVLLNQETLAAFERDPLQREVARTQGMVRHHWQRNEAGQLTGHLWQSFDDRGNLVDTPRPWRTWEYDKAGQLTSLNDIYRGHKIFQYNSQARLAEVTRYLQGKVHQTETFRYDVTGNLLTDSANLERTLSEQKMVQQSKGDRLSAFLSSRKNSLVSYTYDGHGNRRSSTLSSLVAMENKPGLIMANFDPDVGNDIDQTGDGTELDSQTTRYQYDAAHQLVGIEHADGRNTQYRYDAWGRRIAKLCHVPGQPVRTTYFVWDGNWMIQEIQKIEGSDTEKRTTYIAHPDGMGPLARVVNGKTQYYVNDHLGTPQEIYDEHRQIVWAADYSSYGQIDRFIVGREENPIRFPGQYYDAESGLHYNRYRYYDSDAGRYINQDPIGIQGGMNAYAYVQGNPVQRQDPLGLITWTGEGYQASAGVVSGTHYKLRSECINGQMARVEVLAGGGTYGRGLNVAAQGFDTSFVDGLDHIDPNVFNGDYSEAGANVSFIKGIGLGSVKLGDAYSESLLTIYKRGYSAGIGFGGGGSKVLSSRMESCRPECTSCKNTGKEAPPNTTPLPPDFVPPVVPPNAIGQMFGGAW